MNDFSYKKKIVDAVRAIGYREGSVVNITFESIAIEANISVKNIEREFADMDDLWVEMAKLRFKEHEGRSKKIVQLSGSSAISTLIKHDLKLIHNYRNHGQEFKRKEKALEARTYAKNYIEKRLPDFYFDLLRLNPSLLPNRSINARLYAQFIVHSMFFFTKHELAELEPNNEVLTSITHRLVSSIFARKKV